MGVPNFKSRYLATHLNKMLEWGVEFIAFVLQYCLQIQCTAFQKGCSVGLVYPTLLAIQLAQCPGVVDCKSTCADSIWSFSSRLIVSVRIAADSCNKGSGRLSASFSRAVSLAISRSLPINPSSLSSDKGSSCKPRFFRIVWRSLC